MTHIVFLDAGSMGDTDLSVLQLPKCQLQCFDSTAPQQVAERLADADIAIVNKVVLNQSILQALPQLKLICVAATGVNNIDLSAAAQLGIKVCHVRGYANTTVPQHAIALLLGLTNQISNYQQTLARGEWSQSSHFCLHSHPLTELDGKCFVVVGYGALGQATAGLAAAFGMRVLISEHAGARECREGRVSFDEALRQADVLSLHCPLNKDTLHLLNRETLALLPNGAMVINTARGDLIDEAALLNELKTGRLSAGLDVLSTEPPAASHILLQHARPNLLITPHIGWATPEARRRMSGQLRDNIAAFLAGHSLRQL
ncbi:D-2-hydroxyacid dehydrogenase [Arsukibacterium sp. UBA3155]|uniref:D-2-hydroxyacid dehydrogenase n=1 Tax=Arsukibacterium sp. UBA3155 TaxID=1946058 RepID=UPI0025B9EFED|nr:D-2-hydroxyacid dehydrogenase [Arsukibacterium sp. UBA3155]|tara:strand:- start:13965 stop:14912 length:948 start_codon:yes stop_codon:yes gene_type:complete